MLPPPQIRLLRRSVAFVWIATAVGVLHPSYRQLGGLYLSFLGLSDALMYLACFGELMLGLWLWFSRPTRWDTGLQLAAIGFFTAVLAWADPALMVHPFGVLTKNLPMVAVIVGSLRLAEGGWDPLLERLMRWGMAIIWITEGLLPKVLFQQPYELEVVRRVWDQDPSTTLVVLGVVQVVSGILALILPKGRSLGVLLSLQIMALVLLPLLVSIPEPTLWVHPFGPLIKNVPIIAGTWVWLRRCSI